MLIFTTEPSTVRVAGKTRYVWSMLQKFALIGFPSDDAIFKTVRSSSLVSGFREMPCQVPVRSCANKPLAGRMARAIQRLRGFRLKQPQVSKKILLNNREAHVVFGQRGHGG